MEKYMNLRNPELPRDVQVKLGWWTLFLFMPILVLQGFVGEKLWGWFGTEIGLPDITIAQALGLLLLVSFFTHQFNRDVEYGIRYLAYAVATPLICWGWGAVIHFWFM